MNHERGPIQDYEIHWQSGHTETIQAHQVSYRGGDMFSGAPEVVQFHGEVDGQWMLVLRALGSDLRTVRNVTQTEAAS